MLEVIPTVVPDSVDDVAALIARCRAFSSTFHVDAADGRFAANTTWMPHGETLPDSDKMYYEAHLMVASPEAAGLAFASAGAKRIIVHAETLVSEEDAKRMFDVWKAAGANEIGLALRLDSPLEALDPYIFLADSVTLMSIGTIGQQGATFDQRAFGRAGDLHARYPELGIEVDGGVGKDQIPALARVGVRRFSVGSALAKSDDPAKTHSELLQLANAAL